MQVWMLDFMQYWGFWGIVAMAWPNAAFDMCGIVWPPALLLLDLFRCDARGQGFIKAPLQGVFFCTLFRKSTSGM